jgi:tetratricopeptide (TPR) repeat protein
MAKRPEFKDSPEPMLLLADFYMRGDETALVEATMKQAVETFKDDVSLKRKLAAFYTQNKNWDAALKLLDPASPDKQVRQQIVEIYMLAGRFPEAEKLLRGLLQSESKEAQLHALLGVVLLNQGKREQASEAMNTALDLDPKNATALYSRGQLRLSSVPPQVDDAIRDLQLLRDTVPQHVEARVSLADAYKRKYRPEDAARELEVALSLAPSRRDIRVNLLDLYTKGRVPKWGDAERLINDVISAEPKEVMWRRVLAKMYSARGKHLEAAGAAREAIMLEPTNGELIRDYFDVLETGKNWQQLDRECNELLNGDAGIAKSGWWIYVKRGIAKRNRGDKQGAMEDFMTAFKITSEMETGGISQMQVHVVEKMAEHLDTKEAIRRAETLANNDPRWKVVLAYLHHTDKNPRKAFQLIEEVRGQMSEAPLKDKLTTLSVAGTIYMLNEQYDQARSAYEDMLKLEPENTAAMNNVACMLAEYGSSPDPKKALEYSTKAYNLLMSRNQSDPNILDTHGWVHVLCGGPNIDIGIEYLNDAIKSGDLPEAHFHMGEAMLKKKMPEEAVKSFARAAEILREREAKGQQVDSKLRQRIDDGAYRAEMASKTLKITGP